MTFFDALILGLVEGFTEFLPISSTAHLILASALLNLEQSAFLKSFEVIIQLGAILSVVFLYWRKFFDIETLKKIIFGFIPTAILGLLFYKTIKLYLGDLRVVLWSLFIGGILLIVFELWHKKQSKADLSRSEISNIECAYIGLFQAIAFIPGVSRSAATILGGMTLGIGRATIAEYSFLLAVPTMFAATGLDILKNREVILESGNLGLLSIGFIASFVFGICAIKGLLAFIKKRDFIPFGVYRIIIAGLFFLFFIS